MKQQKQGGNSSEDWFSKVGEALDNSTPEDWRKARDARDNDQQPPNPYVPKTLSGDGDPVG